MRHVFIHSTCYSVLPKFSLFFPCIPYVIFLWKYRSHNIRLFLYSLYIFNCTNKKNDKNFYKINKISGTQYDQIFGVFHVNEKELTLVPRKASWRKPFAWYESLLQTKYDMSWFIARVKSVLSNLLLFFLYILWAIFLLKYSSYNIRIFLSVHIISTVVRRKMMKLYIK